MSEQTLDISWEVIGKFFLIICSLVMLYLVRDIVIWFFFALIISIVFELAISFLMRLRLPKFFAAALVYVSIFGALGLMIYITAPIFISEINQLIQNIPDYFEKINPILRGLGFEVAKNFESLTADFISVLKESSGSILKAVAAFFGGIYSTFIILTLSFYISL